MSSKIQKIIVGFVVCFFTIMVSVNSFAQNARNRPFVTSEKNDLSVMLENSGPYEVCVGDSAPPFKVQEAYMDLATGCCYSLKKVFAPQIPEIFNSPGVYTYKIIVTGTPIYFLPRSKKCMVLGPKYIGDFTVIVRSGLCCDQCNGGEDFELADVYLTNWMNRFSPDNMEAFEELLNFVTQKSVGWAIKILRIHLLEGFIPKDLYEKIFNSIERLDKKLIKMYGARIWVQFKRKECIETFCFPFSGKKVWHDRKTSYFYRCDVGDKDSDFGLGFGRNTAAAAKEIEKAIPLCIDEAEKNAYYFQ